MLNEDKTPCNRVSDYIGNFTMCNVTQRLKSVGFCSQRESSVSRGFLCESSGVSLSTALWKILPYGVTLQRGALWCSSEERWHAATESFLVVLPQSCQPLQSSSLGPLALTAPWALQGPGVFPAQGHTRGVWTNKRYIPALSCGHHQPSLALIATCIKLVES